MSVQPVGFLPSLRSQLFVTTYPSVRAFAGTYTVRTHEHPYDLVEEYRRVLEASANHPSKKSAALSSVVELPRSRIRSWVESDGRPDVVRGIQTAESNEWLAVDIASEQFQALNTLVAGVFSGGSINANYVPAFAPDSENVLIVRIQDALDNVGTKSYTRADGEPHRATEVLPASDASVLGRILVAMGAPKGEKNEDRTMSLPEYLGDAPAAIKEDFVSVYLLNRATRSNESDVLQIIGARAASFFAELGALIEDVAGAPVYVKEDRVYVSAEAVRALGMGRSETLSTE